MRIAKIENGKIKRIIIGTLEQFPDYIDFEGKHGGPGWADNGDGTYARPTPPPAHEPSTIQDVELMLTQALAKLRTIRD